MKKFIKNIVLFIFPVIVFVGLINYFADPAHIFNDDYEKGMVEIINSGNNVANAGNYDARLFQKIYIDKLSESKNIIVIGSSRSMQIREGLFNGTFFNNSVSGAVLEDYIAITQLYAKNKKLPNKVIIGVDPWIFNENHSQERWETLKENYFSFLKDNKLDNNNNITQNYLKKYLFENKLTSFLSVRYFQESIKYIASGNYFQDDYFSTKTKELSSNVRLDDGSLVYRNSFRNSDLSEINNKAKNYINGSVYSIEQFLSISDRYRNQFEVLINFYRNKHIDVVLFLPPYHPTVYNYINNNKEYKMIKNVEIYLNEFADKSNVKILGSYNPENLNLDSNSFYDGMHPKEEVIQKLFN
jgi:hypothetical protein